MDVRIEQMIAGERCRRKAWEALSWPPGTRASDEKTVTGCLLSRKVRARSIPKWLDVCVKAPAVIEWIERDGGKPTGIQTAGLD